VKLCFAKKRKTLLNNLRSTFNPDEIRDTLERLSLRPDARAEQLSVPLFAALRRLLQREDERIGEM
jgi:16S rRNA A1518/A1519 N6-dimethyltransferase RsmA/KsgA/DIM1 with predicted DNA glycosylase/AP lyase activity